MEGQHKFYLFGEVAVREYGDNDFPAFLKVINACKWNQPDMNIYHYDESIDSADEVLEAFDGYMAWQPIPKEEYDAIHNYMHPPPPPPPKMFEQILPQSAKTILWKALEIVDANMNNLLKLGVEVNGDELEYLRHDIMGLKAMMSSNYELKITMTQEQKDRFTLNHKVDFPEYTSKDEV
jgi:hypothetical protein